MKIKLLTIFIFVLSSSFCSLLAKPQPPQWTVAAPQDSEYFYGVGRAAKQRRSVAHYDNAMRMAMGKLSEDISFSLKSNAIMVQYDDNSLASDDYSHIVEVNSDNSIEGYEQVEIFETKKEYWVLIRLSRTLYAQKQAAKHADAIQNAMRAYTLARRAVEEKNMPHAIRNFALTLDRLKSYYHIENIANFNGQDVNLVVDSYAQLKSIFSKVNISLAQPTIDIKYSLPYNGVQCCVNSLDSNFSLVGMPIIAKFLLADQPSLFSSVDSLGYANFKISKVRSNVNEEQLNFSLDLNKLLHDDNIDFSIYNWINALVVPSQSLTMRVVKPSVCVVAHASNIGKPIDTDVHTIPVVESFEQNDFHFSDALSDADYVIDITTETAAYQHVDGLYTSILTGRLDVIFDNRVLLSLDLGKIYGTQLSYNRAGDNAYYQLSQVILQRVWYDVQQILIK